ncbi:MAG: hypothetical protein QOE88_2287 [Verrucomicrobiota bacterium]|nr:hypothetical protein [Verrucomicrobiota bacterium]
MFTLCSVCQFRSHFFSGLLIMDLARTTAPRTDTDMVTDTMDMDRTGAADTTEDTTDIMAEGIMQAGTMVAGIVDS